MKRDPSVREAIDKSLYGVRFNQNDMRSVLRAVRRSDEQAEQTPRRRKKLTAKRLELAFLTLLVAAVIAPVSYLSLRTLGTSNVDIVTTQGSVTPMTHPTAQPVAAAQTRFTPAQANITEAQAIAIAAERFGTLCDTSIFTFEEYTVSTSLAPGEIPVYTVTLTSIYGNGCTFAVTIDALTGDVLTNSSPGAAVLPAGLTRENASIASWYDKYGAYRFTWPLEQQAEFSRRYEGYLCRAPLASLDAQADNGASSTAHEADEAQALSAARTAMQSYNSSIDAGALTYYATLRSERAYADGIARYEIYAFDAPVTDTLPDSGYLITLRANTAYGFTPSVTPIDRAAITERENAMYTPGQ